MQSAEIVAVAKSVKDKALKAASKEVQPGEYTVDMLVRVLGSFRKGEDYQTTVPAKVDWTLAFALALSKVNKETRASIVDTVVKAMANGKDSDEHKALAAQVKDEIQPKLDEIKGETLTTASGKITTDLTVEIVGGGKVVQTA